MQLCDSYFDLPGTFRAPATASSLVCKLGGLGAVGATSYTTSSPVDHSGSANLGTEVKHARSSPPLRQDRPQVRGSDIGSRVRRRACPCGRRRRQGRARLRTAMCDLPHRRPRRSQPVRPQSVRRPAPQGRNRGGLRLFARLQDDRHMGLERGSGRRLDRRPGADGAGHRDGDLPGCRADRSRRYRRVSGDPAITAGLMEKPRGSFRSARRALMAALLAAVPTLAQAESAEEFFQTATVSMYVGSGSGGGYDAIARLVARHMSRFLPGNPSFVIKNMPTAAGVAAASFIYNSAPRDGSAILAAQNAPLMLPLYGSSVAHYDPRQFE